MQQKMYMLKLIEVAIITSAINNHYAYCRAKLITWVIDMAPDVTGKLKQEDKD